MVKVDKDTGVVTMTIDEYQEIQEQMAWLDALEAAGVDNWDGIDEAQEIFRENNPDYEEN